MQCCICSSSKHINLACKLPLRLSHLIGTSYDMGYAHGELMREQAKAFMDDVWLYIEVQVVSIVTINHYSLKVIDPNELIL